MDKEWNKISTWEIESHYSYHYVLRKDNVEVDIRNYDVYPLYDWDSGDEVSGAGDVEWRDYTILEMKRVRDKTKEEDNGLSLKDYFNNLLCFLDIEDRVYKIVHEDTKEDLFMKEEVLRVRYDNTEPDDLMVKGESVMYYKSKEVDEALKCNPEQSIETDGTGYYKAREENIYYGNHLVTGLKIDNGNPLEVLLRTKIVEFKALFKEGKWVLESYKYLIKREDVKNYDDKILDGAVADTQMSGLYFLIDKDPENKEHNEMLNQTFDNFIRSKYKQWMDWIIEDINYIEEDEE